MALAMVGSILAPSKMTIRSGSSSRGERVWLAEGSLLPSDSALLASGASVGAYHAMPGADAWLPANYSFGSMGRCFVLAFVFFLAVPTGHATTLVVLKEISVSRALTGRVLVAGTDELANGVTVDLCSAGWKTLFKSTKTDEKGHFELEQPATGKLFYIRVSAPGMNILEFRVRIDRHAADDLTIRLSVAT